MPKRNLWIVHPPWEPGGSPAQYTMRQVHLGPARGRLGDSQAILCVVRHWISSSVYTDKGSLPSRGAAKGAGCCFGRGERDCRHRGS